MSRDIIVRSRDFQPAGIQEDEDNYISRVAKLVPVDIISAYLFGFNLIRVTVKELEDARRLEIIFFAAVAILTPFYLKYIAKIKVTKTIVICCISFLIWVFSIGGPVDGFLFFGKYSPELIGSLIAALYTLVIPKVAYPDAG